MWTTSSFSVWKKYQVPTLMVNVVEETKSKMIVECYIHVKVHSQSVNIGQSGSIDQGVEKEQIPRAQMNKVGEISTVTSELSRKALNECIVV